MTESADSPSSRPNPGGSKRRRDVEGVFELCECVFGLAARPLAVIAVLIAKWVFAWAWPHALFLGGGVWLVCAVVSEVFEYAVAVTKQRRKPKRGGIYWFSETILGEITLVILLFGIPALFFYILSLF